jgi:uncharacterized Rossmann fold enzyme
MAKARGAMLKRKTHWSSKWASIVCYGPSLKDTWHLIKRPIVSVSGAHDFLVERGVVPDYHIDCDPRAHKAKMCQPQKAVTYLMATVCHPDWWPKLAGHNVRLWHLINGNDLETVAWVLQNDPKGVDCMISGGSSVGMRAMEVMAALGFRRFKFHGMDCSYLTDRHAGPHLGKNQDKIFVKAGDRVFQTTRQMLEAAIEMEEFIKTQDAELAFFGDGLMQETALQLKEMA